MGVKHLWTLLGPVGRPVMLETVEGKTMAIDSSIWLYQFQATMRDKDGRPLVNAHILGFFRRICKLLFYGIKPVFVFDGGAPVLKKRTINERRRKKSGAAASYARTAEKLLAAQLRREALNAAELSNARTQATRSEIPRQNTNVGTIDDSAVFLEDLETSTFPRPAPPPRTPSKPSTSTPTAANEPSSTSSKEDSAKKAKRAKWQDHDPYKLPDLDLETTIANLTTSANPDPRLASEAELLNFIEEMRPEDFDITSPAFRELPTEVQYEIIGDLRLKSRQTSFKRLRGMLKSSKTPLDFSRAQIKNLQQRNALTQRLLTTTDMVGTSSSHSPTKASSLAQTTQIKGRVASERNREYMLVKNEGADGGWVLAIKDEKGSTANKPIPVDDLGSESSSEDEGSDGEGRVPAFSRFKTTPLIDPDLRSHRQSEVLQAIESRKHKTAKGLRPLTTKASNGNGRGNEQPIASTSKAAPVQPLFTVSSSSDEDEEGEEDEDLEMALALSESRDLKEANDLRRAMELSKRESELAHPAAASSSSKQAPPPLQEDEDDDLYVDDPVEEVPKLKFGHSNLFSTTTTKTVTFRDLRRGPRDDDEEDEEDDDMEEVVLVPVQNISTTNDKGAAAPMNLTDSDEHMEEVTPLVPVSSAASKQASAPIDIRDSESDEMEEITPSISQPKYTSTTTPTGQPAISVDSGDDDMEEVAPPEVSVSFASPPRAPSTTPLPPPNLRRGSSLRALAESVHVEMLGPPEKETDALQPPVASTSTSSGPSPVVEPVSHPIALPRRSISPLPLPPAKKASAVTVEEAEESSEEFATDWSRSPSPTSGAHQKGEEDDSQHIHIDDAQVEAGDFAHFMSRVKGRNLNDVRNEIDEEIRALNKEKKNSLRDSEDITQMMVGQIQLMLRLFGIPYITAPMEAEAQCAALVSLGLVEGIITDDSDVFLFGGARVFRNMFNQSKTVECFLLSDLSRELGLDRGKLVRLAYLLGSDYVEGIPGIGPVVAMELLKEFPGDDGLIKFREWWEKVQTGRDVDGDTKSKFRKRFKKKFKDLYLADDWPDTAVQDAYYHPTVDESREPFKWGLPNLDALREFFGQELGWTVSKVDESLLPIIRKVGQRNQAGALNKQGTLETFFDVAPGTGAYAPRQKQAYASKRLQKVVSDYRKEQASRSEDAEADTSSDEDHNDVDLAAKGKGKAKASTQKKTGTAATAKGKKRTTAKTAPKTTKRRKKNAKEKEKENSESGSEFEANVPEDLASTAAPPPPKLRPRPKPRVRAPQAQPTVSEEAGGNGEDE